MLFSRIIGKEYLDIITIDESGFNLSSTTSKYAYDIKGSGSI